MEAVQRETCVNHDVQVSRVRALESSSQSLGSSVQGLQAGQHRMEIAIVKIESALERIEDKIDNVGERVGAMEGAYVQRDRVDKLEDRLEDHNEKQDEKINEVKAFIYKVSGVLSFIVAAVTLAPAIIKLFLGG